MDAALSAQTGGLRQVQARGLEHAKGGQVMTQEQLLQAAIAAKSEINLLRWRHTQFVLPLADAKLIRISNYLQQQISELETAVWKEAEMAADEVKA